MSIVQKDTPSVVRLPQLINKCYELKSPRYLSTIVPPEAINGGSSVSITAGNGSYSQFSIPDTVYNISRSRLEFRFQPAATAAAYNYVATDCFPFIDRIEFFSKNQQDIGARVEDVVEYTSTVWPAEIKQDDLESFDYVDSTTGKGPLIQMCNSLTSGNIVKNKSNDGAGKNNAFTNFIEQRHLRVGTAVNDRSPDLYISFPLGLLLNSFFAKDNDVYFGQNMILKVWWTMGSKMYWSATSNNDAITGAANGTTADITNLQLRLAQEDNEELVHAVMKQFNEGGIMDCWSVIASSQVTNSSHAATQDVQVKYDSGFGKRLQKIYYTIFNAGQQYWQYYDHANDANNAGTVVATGGKIKSFYTMLNNNRRQQYNLTSGYSPVAAGDPFLDDYALLSDKLKGSLILSGKQYMNQWFFLEDFGDIISPADKPLQEVPETSLIRGIPLVGKEYTYTIRATTYQAVNSDYIHRLFAICSRDVLINKNGIQWV